MTDRYSSEGRGQRFESSRVRQYFQQLTLISLQNHCYFVVFVPNLYHSIVKWNKFMATINKRGPYQWLARVRKKGVSVNKTFENKREAEEWAAVIESEITRNVFVDRSLAEKISLAEVIDHYITEVAPTHKGHQSEILRLQKFKRDEPLLAGKRMAALSPFDFEKYRDRRLSEVSASSVKRELGLLRAVIEGQKRRLGLAENPVSDVKRPRAKDFRDVRLEPGDEQKFLEAFDELRNPYAKHAFILAIETAMRRGELLAMTWDNVDMQHNYVHLPDTKTGEARDVPLSRRAIKVLESMPRSMDGRVLPTSPNALKKCFERAREKAGLTHINFHDLRHEATSRLFEAGWNVMEVSAVTGHKDLQSLKRYTQLRAVDLAMKMRN